MSIERIAKTVLGRGAVLRVDVRRDFDRDGNEICRIDVIFDKQAGPLDVEGMLELPMRIREAGLVPKDSGYPIVSYVDVNETALPHAAE